MLPRLLDAIGFQHGLLVGHSDGASIAAIYGGSVQDHRMPGLVLMAPHFIVEDVTSASIAEVRKAYDTTDLRRGSRVIMPTATPPCMAGPTSGSKNDFRAWDLTEDLAYIRVPILIVQGEDDQYGTMRQVEIAQEECYCPVEVADAARRQARAAPRGAGGHADAVADFVKRLCEAQQGGDSALMLGRSRLKDGVFARLCDGHPRLRFLYAKTWMAGTSPAMTSEAEHG